MTPRGKVLAWASRALPLIWGCVIYPDVAAAQRFYWLNTTSTISRSNLDGTEIEPVFVGGEGVFLTGLAFDSSAGLLYWSEAEGSGASRWVGRIRRMDPDGGSPETVLETPGELIGWLTIDSVNGHVYWNVLRSVQKLRRADLDGSNIVTLLEMPDGVVEHMALDVEGGHLYWFYHHGSVQIIRSKLDGSGSEAFELFDNSPLSLHQTAFEPTERQLYLVASDLHSTYEMYQWEFGSPTPKRVEISSRSMGIIGFDDVSRTVYWKYDSRLSVLRTSFSGCDTRDVMRVDVEPNSLISVAVDSTARPALDLARDLCPNSFGTPRPGITQAAVFGTQSFNPNDIDPSSLRLERSDGLGGEIAPLGLGSHRLTLQDVGSAGAELCGCSSPDPDGHFDAVIRFSAADIRRLVRKGDTGEAVRLTLRGKLKDGRPIASVDCVQAP